jgi:hypothetical protein
LNDDYEKEMKWKIFTFNVYGSKENAYKAMIEFQNKIYPINF